MNRKLFVVGYVLVILLVKSIHCDCPTGSGPIPTPAPAPANGPDPANGPAPANGLTADAVIPSDKYPCPRRDESVEDTYPGCTKIKDPYRWMENLNSTETKKFIQEENALSKKYLEKSPFRTELLARYKELRDHPSVWGTFQKGKYFFTFRIDGSKTQSLYVLYKSDSIKGKETVFLDPNTLSKDGSLDMDCYAFTDDGQMFAYLITDSKSDGNTSEVYFKNVENGNILKEKLVNVTSSDIAWSPDNKGIFYIVTAGKGKDLEDPTDDPQKLYYHFMGTTQCKDIVVAEFPDHPEYSISYDISDCGKYLIITPSTGSGYTNLVYVIDISQGIKTKLELKPIVAKMDSKYDFVGNNEHQFVFRTNNTAENFKLISIDITNLDPKSWKDLVAENKKDVLDWALAAHDKYMVLCYIRDVKNVLQLHDITSGQMIHEFKLDIGMVGEDSCFCDRKSPHLVFLFKSPLTPGIIYHCDLSKPSFDLEVLNEVKLKNFDREKFTVEQIFYSSKDGTKIPMFVVHKKVWYLQTKPVNLLTTMKIAFKKYRLDFSSGGALAKSLSKPRCLKFQNLKDLKKDGNNFTYMFGVGDLDCSMFPNYVTSSVTIMSNFDGIYVIASIRGGGEYGDEWHKAGMLEKKQNSFDDFIAAAEYLIKEKYTNSKLLAIQGGGPNGGLLIGACLTQRPDLFGAVYIDEGTLDMLRFDKFTQQKVLVTEYGSPTDPKFFPLLHKYSPLHNIKIPEGCDKQYPATMLYAVGSCDPDQPLHSLKFIATLQYEAKKHPNQKNPFILSMKTDTETDSKSDKPDDHVFDDTIDMMSFFIMNLRIKFHPNVCQ